MSIFHPIISIHIYCLHVFYRFVHKNVDRYIDIGHYLLKEESLEHIVQELTHPVSSSGRPIRDKKKAFDD